MKTTRFLEFFILLLSFSGCIACSSDNPGGGIPLPEPEVKDSDTVSVNTPDTLRWEILPPAYVIPREVTKNDIYKLKAGPVFAGLKNYRDLFIGNVFAQDAEKANTLKLPDNLELNKIYTVGLVNGKVYESTATPSFSVTDSLFQLVVKAKPTQSESFFFSSTPVIYHSEKFLHLWGLGNYGVNLDSLVYKDNNGKMKRKTGLIYILCNELFSLSMDVEPIIKTPLAQELLSQLVYINDISYGRFTLLLVESDAKEQKVKILMNKLRLKSELTAEDKDLLKSLDVYNVGFNTSLHPNVKIGDYTLATDFFDGKINPDIIPLTFSVCRLADYVQADYFYTVK